MATWLITGCSSGLGRFLAKAVLERGWNAIVTVRDPITAQYMAVSHPDTALILPLDVKPSDLLTAAPFPNLVLFALGHAETGSKSGRCD
jgi:NAD(P)-dependent dehydrogenase (short-subunit alcohol dehydrogenase family)